MKSEESKTLQELLQMPLSEQVFEQILEMVEREQSQEKTRTAGRASNSTPHVSIHDVGNAAVARVGTMNH